MPWKLPPIVVHDRLTMLEAGAVPWHIADYRLAAAHQVSAGRGVRVGIVDTGIDETHARQKSLSGRVVAAGFHCRLTARDILGHGTHVAGIVAGRCRASRRGGPGRGKAAMIRVMVPIGRSAAVSCVELGCHVINLSLGSDQPAQSTLAAIREARERGCVVVAAAGNSGGQVNWPAKDRSTLATGAVDRRKQIASFSCRGPELDVAAPGVEIQSTYLNGGYAVLSGTSMAAPFVSGMLALRLAWQREQPADEVVLVDAANVVHWLAAIAEDVGEPGRDELYGVGLPRAEQLFLRRRPRGEERDVSDPAPEAKGIEIDLGIAKVRLPGRCGDYVSIGP